jgi:myosin heavy subunit
MEIASLNDFRQESNKILQEKFALSHKLDQLQPELNHLKQQLETHRAVIAQKQDLERQVSSLEVELENEKRSKNRLQSKTRDDDQWKDQFEEAKRELEKTKKEHSRELREVRGEVERLEGLLEETRSKRKHAQTDLKNTRAELEVCRAELEAARKAAQSNKPAKKTVTMKEPGRKRRAQDMSLEDISIGTPGPDEATLKRPFNKRGAEHALVGEKSTFSITPFLNRTKNFSDELSEIQSPTGNAPQASEPIVDPEEDVDEADEAVEPAQVEPAEDVMALGGHAGVASDVEDASAAKGRKPRGRPRKALDDAPTTKKNMPVTARGKNKAAKPASKLEMVMEEVEAGEQENKIVQMPKKVPELKSKVAEPLFKPSNAAGLDADGRKKKRKILGGSNKTLFDEEDGETTVPRPAKIQLAPGRRLKAPLGGASSAFGGATFSPLKRDRRGVGASFLQ